jgi:hypothetical protein
MTEEKDATQPSKEFQRFDEAVDKLFGMKGEEVRNMELSDSKEKSK